MRPETCDGGKIDDPTLALLLHGGNRGSAAEEGPLDIHAVEAIPDLVRQSVQIGEIHEGGDAGVVHQDVEASERLQRPRDQRAGLTVLGDIRLDRQRLAAGLLDQVGRFLGLFPGLRVVDDYLGPLSSIADGDGAANPHGRSRD